MTEIDFKGMPKDFTFCSRKDCTRKDTCLHWQAYHQHPVVMRAYFYDPRWIDKQGGTESCPCYADCTPVTYVAGFREIFDQMTKSTANELRERLIEEFGQYNYYRYRNGDFLMPPSVQETILNTARELGITTPITFSNKEERIYWGEQKVSR